MLEPREGLLTFRAEGNNDSSSMYYSRKIHWPAQSAACTKAGSGVTIGRGYDLGSRPKNEILSTLLSAGLSKEQVDKLVKGSRLQGCQADEFVRKNKKNIGEITESQQKQLFEIVYREYVSHARYFYDKVKNNAKIINIVTWEKSHPVLKEVLVDMKYQGVLYSSAIPVFGTNNKDNVIRYINSKPFLFNYDKNRGRVKYIKDNMK